MAKERITEVAEMLHSPDKAVRLAAADRVKELISLTLTLEEKRLALQAAAGEWGSRSPPEISATFVLLALSHFSPESSSTTVELFGRFSGKARAVTVEMLASHGDAEAAKAYLLLARRWTSQGLMPEVSIDAFARSKEAVNVLIPALIEFVGHIGLKEWIYSFFLEAMEKALVAECDLTPVAEAVVGAYRPIREQIQAMQGPPGGDWPWEDQYAEIRCEATLLIDIMGYLPGEAVVEILQDALGSNDPLLPFLASLGLLRHGYAVPADVFYAVASNPETRIRLYRALALIDRLELFPAEFASHEALAESNMVDWLVFPTELGRPPHEIELMETFTNITGQLNYYLFRFRTYEPHWSARDGWMAGLSGPFEISKPPPADVGEHTFSSFTHWDEKTPRGHFEAILGSSKPTRG